MSTTSIYVGNLPFRLSEEELKAVFEKYGVVYDVTLINDKETGKPRGFGFVEIQAEKANEAVEALNGSDCEGRTMVVSLAKQSRRSPLPAGAR